MDYLLAAHINVTGGEAAAAQFSQMAIQVNNFGAAAAKANTGVMSTGMAEATKQAGFLDKAMSQVGTAIIRMGTYSALFAGWGFLKDGVNALLDFDQAMTESLAIQTGVTDRIRGQMEDMAKSIAVEFGQAPKEVAEGFYFMASAGLNAQQQMAALPTTMAFAKAGMFDLEQATEQLFDALSAVGQKSDDPVQLQKNITNMADVLTTAAVRSQATVEQMGYALTTKAGAAIKAFNLDLNESVGVLEVFANQGIKGRTAGERFSMLIRDMAIKSGKFGQEWAKMGIEVFDSSGKFNSLITIFEQLDAALLPLSDEKRKQALLNLGFTMRDMNTVMGVLGESKTLKSFVDELDMAGGTAQRVAENQMESLRAKLGQLSAAFQVGAIEGFEKLMEFGEWLGDTFAPAIEAVSPALASLASGFGTVFAGLGKAVAVAGETGLEALADAIERIGSFASQHQGAVQLFGAALAGLAATQLVSSVLNLASAFGETLALKVLYAQDAVNRFIVNLMNIRATEGVLAAVRSGFGSLLTLLSSPIVIGAGIGIAIFGMIEAFNDGKKAAKEFGQELEKKYDTGTLGGATAAAEAAAANLERAREQMRGLRDDGAGEIFTNILGTTLDTLTPKFYSFSGNIFKARGELSQARQEAERFKAAQQNIGDGFQTVADALDNIPPFVLDPLTQQLEKIRVSAGGAAVSIDTSVPALQRLAAANNIDLAAPYEEWAPLLAQAAVDLVKVRDVASQMGGSAEGVGTKMSTMEQAIADLGDEAKNAEEKLSALKTVMDGLSGGQQNLFDMTTRYRESLAELRTSILEGSQSFDEMTEAGRKSRDSLSQAADNAREVALAHATATGSMQEGANQLTTYAAGIAATMAEAGVAQPVIDELLRTMGLTPEQINTLFNITTTPGEPENTNKALDEAAHPREAPIVATPANVDPTNTDLTAIADKERVAEIYAQPTNAGPADETFNQVARFRESEAHQFPTGHPDTDFWFGWGARRRDSQANQVPTGHGTVDATFNQSARTRDSWVNQWANTFGAENALNYAARTRDSRINVVVSTTSITGVGAFEPSADGNIFRSYAGGGFENHVAQIGPAGRGVSRLWNEPETGGEAYIPLAMSKRARSLAIWEQTGKMLGVGGPTAQTMNVSVPINVAINGATDPAATGRAVAAQVEAGISKAMQRMLVEMRSY